MPRNASGNYSLPAGNPVVPGTTITSTWANTTMADIASVLTDSLSRSGDGGMQAPLRLADGLVATPSLAFNNDLDTGLFLPTAGRVNFVSGGTTIFYYTGTGMTVDTALTVTGTTTLSNLTLTGNFSVGGTLGVTGTTTLAGATATSLSVGGSPVVVETRNLIAGAGLTGGGTLAANRTFNVGAGAGISVAADAVAIDSSWVSSQNWSFTGNISVGGTLGVTGVTTLTDDLVVDTDTLFVDASADRVGIGTTSPSANLDVQGATGSSAVPSIAVRSDEAVDLRVYGSGFAGSLFGEPRSNLGGLIGQSGLDHLVVGTLGAAPVVIGTNNSAAIFINSSGNVGIGTTSPDELLHLADSGPCSVTLQRTSSVTVQSRATIRSINNAGDVVSGINFAGGGANDQGDIDFLTTNSASGGDLFSLPVRLHIDGNGNVGIGTASPGALLHVNGDNDSREAIFEDATQDVIVEIRTLSTKNGQIWFSDDDATGRGRLDYDHAVDALGIYTAGTEQVTINSSGNVFFRGLSSTTSEEPANDSNDGYLLLVNDEVTRVQRQNARLVQSSRSVAQTFTDNSANTHQILTGSTNRTWTMPTGVGLDGAIILLTAADTATITIAGSGVTITSADNLTTVRAGGTAVLIRFSSTEWFLAGDLE